MTQGLAAGGQALDKDLFPGLERIVGVVRQLSLARDLDRVAEIVRGEARRLTGADGATLVLREGEYSHYADEDAIGPLWKGQRFRAACCVSGWVMEHGEPVMIEDVQADSRVPLEAYRPTFVRSLLMVPIRPEAPLGAIGNYWGHRHRATETELRILQALADSTAVALENVLLYTGLEARVRERTEALEREIAERRQVEEMLRESRQRFAGVVESAMDAIVGIERSQRIVFFNAAAEAMFRCPAIKAIGKSVGDFIPKRFRADHAAQVQRFLASGVTSRRMGALQRLWALRADGEEFPIEASISKIDLAGGPLGTVIIRDISQRMAMEAALRESEARFRKMADTAPAMLWVTEPDGWCSFLSQGWYEFTGQADGAGAGLGWLDAVHPEDRDAMRECFESAARERKAFEHELRLRCADGAYRWVLDAGRPRIDDDGGFLGYIGSVIDITERKRAEETVRHSALHDPLTGLPNRALTLEFCEHLLAGSKRGRVQSAVLFVDLDRFKPINDTYGHPVGDAVLEEVARRLRSCVRAEDVVGRVGGDEFLVVLSHVHEPSEAGQAAAHIVARLARPYTVRRPDLAEPLELETSPSIGISLFPDHGTDLASLIERADAAMYEAKAAGRAGFRFYAGDEPQV